MLSSKALEVDLASGQRLKETQTEAVDDMRAHLSYDCSRCTVESKKAGRRLGRSNIPLRHKQHETSSYNRYFAQSQRLDMLGYNLGIYTC